MADTETPYWHAGLGFGFELPEGWRLELESANAVFPALVSMRAGDARVMAAARGAMSTELSERAASMQEELAARSIEARPVAAGLSFPDTGNVAAVEFEIDGNRQRWVSMVANGLEFSFTHTGSYEEVRKGLERLAATFRMPQEAQVRPFLIARALSPTARAADLERLSHFQRVAARFHVPAAKPPKRSS